MSEKEYTQRLDEITNLSQFEKVDKSRKNERDPILKEQDRIVSALKHLEKKGKLSETLFKELKPIGSKAAKIYGLGKVHKKGTPLRNRNDGVPTAGS